MSSTKSTGKFKLRHVAGAAVLAYGIREMARWVIGKHDEEMATERARLRAMTQAAKASLPAVRGYYR